MRERIAFQTNVPVTVALAYADGLPVEGRFGDQITYTLADDRVMYVSPPAPLPGMWKVFCVRRDEPHSRNDCSRAGNGSRRTSNHDSGERHSPGRHRHG